jgi:hypothetical protein
MRPRLAIAATAALAAVALAAPARAGIHYRATTTTDAPQAQGQTMEVEAWVDGENAKVSFVASDNPLLAEGAYLLTSDGGQTLLLVNPEEKTYSPFDLGAMAATAGAMLKGLGPLAKISFSNQKIEKLAEEAGPDILGYPTTHYRFRTSYDSVIKIMGMGQSAHNETTTDTWTTKGLSDAGFGAWLRREPPRTGIADLDQMIAGEVGKGIQGVPLKIASTTKATDQRGRETVTSTTMQVTAMKQEPVPAGTFVMPKGYERTELLPTMPGQ